jgi:hypothetical protein
VNPLVVLRTDGFEVVRALAVGLGWRVSTAPAEGRDVVLATSLSSATAVAGAVSAVAAGAGLVADARALEPEDHVALCDDLRRLGALRVVDDGMTPGVEAAALLDLLAAGRSLGASAAVLHLSRRSADRRLAEAREALGAATTAQAVAASRGRALVSPR